MKLKKGTKVIFTSPEELDPHIKVMAEVVGFAKDVREKWPEKFGHIKDDEEIYLVKRVIPEMGMTKYYPIIPIPCCEYL